METHFTGTSYWFEETDLHVTRAIVTADRIALDWVQWGEVGGCVATSQDGVFFEGTYGEGTNGGSPVLNPQSHVEFRLYRAANGEVLLFGLYRAADKTDGGNWLLRLVPVTV